MSSELDVPSTEQIRRRMFASIPHGFDPDEVRDYLQHVGDLVDQLERGIRIARLETENARSEAQGALDAANRRVDAAERRVAELEAAPPTGAYEDVSSRMAELLRAADEQSERLLAEARAGAERLIAEARVEADRVRGESQAWAEQARTAGDQMLRHARSEADRSIAALSERRTMLVTQLQEMQARLMGVMQDLDSTVVAMAPGLWLQRTKTPEDGQTDVEVAAFAEVLRVESEGADFDGRPARRSAPAKAEGVVDVSGGERESG